MTTKWIAILLLAAAPLVAADQQPGRLSFSATLESIRVNARPDDVITRQFKLTLDPQQPRSTFHAKVEDFWRSEDGTQSFYGTPGTLRRIVNFPKRVCVSGPQPASRAALSQTSSSCC